MHMYLCMYVCMYIYIYNVYMLEATDCRSEKPPETWNEAYTWPSLWRFMCIYTYIYIYRERER